MACQFPIFGISPGAGSRWGMAGRAGEMTWGTLYSSRSNNKGKGVWSGCDIIEVEKPSHDLRHLHFVFLVLMGRSGHPLYVGRQSGGRDRGRRIAQTSSIPEFRTGETDCDQLDRAVSC